MRTELRPGATIAARFELQAALGTGSFGAVWSAIDRSAPDGSERRLVALKFLHPNLLANPKTRRRFEREAEILETLRHPRVVRAYELLRDQDWLFICLELLRGHSLREEIIQRRVHSSFIPLDAAVVVLEQLSEALSAAHGHRIVHRDLKPPNIHLLNGRLDDVRLLDFGVAHLIDGERAEATTVGRQLGSLAYMAPEQILGQEVGVPADVFALGTIAFELLTLEGAWTAGLDRRVLGAAAAIHGRSVGTMRLLEVSRRILKARRPRARALRPELSIELDEALERAWAVVPEDRFQTVSALTNAILAALGDVPRRALTQGLSQEATLGSMILEATKSLPDLTLVMPAPLSEPEGPRTETPILAETTRAPDTVVADRQGNQDHGSPGARWPLRVTLLGLVALLFGAAWLAVALRPRPTAIAPLNASVAPPAPTAAPILARSATESVAAEAAGEAASDIAAEVSTAPARVDPKPDAGRSRERPRAKRPPAPMVEDVDL